MMHNQIQKAIGELQLVRNQLAQELESIDAALAALGSSSSATNTNPKPKRSTKPCCTKLEVIDIITGLLKDNGSLSRSELEDLTKDKARNELGKSLSMLAKLLNDALADSMFDEYAPDQFRLADIKQSSISS